MQIQQRYKGEVRVRRTSPLVVLAIPRNLLRGELANVLGWLLPLVVGRLWLVRLVLVLVVFVVPPVSLLGLVLVGRGVLVVLVGWSVGLLIVAFLFDFVAMALDRGLKTVRPRREGTN